MNIKYFYGSKQKPKDVFGDGTPEFRAFHEANTTVAPGACELLELSLASWQKWAKYHAWEMPDGFTVFIPVMVQVETKIEVDELDHASFTYVHEVNQGTETGLSLAANTIHSVDGMVVREISRRCNYDRSGLMTAMEIIQGELDLRDVCFKPDRPERVEKLAMASGFVSLIGVDYVCADNSASFGTEYLERLLALVQKTLTRKSFPVIAIHDEFKAHANNINTVRQTYIDIMAEIAESDLLSFYMTQIRGEYFEVQKYSDNLADLIREGNYAIS